MRQIDELTQTAAENPKDHTARRILSDALRGLEEFELADAIESKTTGRVLIDSVNVLATQTGLPVSMKLLWAAFALIPRLKTALTNPAQVDRFIAPDPGRAPARDVTARPWTLPTYPGGPDVIWMVPNQNTLDDGHITSSGLSADMIRMMETGLLDRNTVLRLFNRNPSEEG
jgi:hypothetical protein